MEDIRYDYTQGQIFSRFSISKFFISLGFEFPWDSLLNMKQVNSDVDLSPEVDSLFPTGTGSEIAYKEMLDKIVNGLTCDRCGEKLNNLPWRTSKYLTLCDTCSSYMEIEYGPDLFGIYPKRISPSEEYPWWL